MTTSHNTSKLPSSISFRPARESDRGFLLEMFREADTWGEDKDVSDSFAQDVVLYVDAWDENQGGVILEENGEPIGASWLLNKTDDEHAAGFVSADIPELAIALAKGKTGGGLGGKLLMAAVEVARDKGKPGVSLAVDLGNDRAFHVYEKLGFEDRGLNEEETCHVMLYDFAKH